MDIYAVMPKPLLRVRNLSGFWSQEKEGFLTRRSGFGMTAFLVFLNER